MTDQEIIQALIARDNQVTQEFFFVRCRPLLCRVMRLVFDHPVDYYEVVNELYLYLMENDAARLRNFQFRSSIYQWIKVVATHYCIKKRNRLIENPSQENLIIDIPEESATAPSANDDINRLLDSMPNKRYVAIIRQLILEDREPEKVAEEMGITMANLYNIKRRAMAQLSQVALNDIREYGR